MEALPIENDGSSLGANSGDGDEDRRRDANFPSVLFDQKTVDAIAASPGGWEAVFGF